MMIDECLIPFHQYAEDHGTYVLAERAREADRARSRTLPRDRRKTPTEIEDEVVDLRGNRSGAGVRGRGHGRPPASLASLLPAAPTGALQRAERAPRGFS
jgi:hypothetical protein